MPDSPRIRWLAPVMLAALVLAAFARLAGNDFTNWDDPQTVSHNPALNPVTINSIARYWQPENARMDLYAPLTYTAWGSIAAVARNASPDRDGVTLAPAAFHSISLLVHLCAAWAVWGILRRLLKSDPAALAGAALFAVHPLQTEAVAWVSGLKDVLSGCLGLTAALFYLQSIEPSLAQSAKRWRYGIASLAFVGATLAKPQGVAIAGVVLVLDWMIVGRPFKRAIVTTFAWFIWCLPVIYIGWRLQPASTLHSPVLLRPLLAGDALAFYLSKVLLPVRLMVDYGRSPEWFASSSARFWTWIIPAALSAICVSLRGKSRRPLGALMLFTAALLPVLGLVKFDYQMYSSVADHYCYVAMLAPALALGMLLANWPWQRWMAPVIVGLAACGALSFQQGKYWLDTQTLFTRNLELNPSSIAAATMLGVFRSEHGDLSGAIALLSQASHDHPKNPLTQYIFANVLLQAGLLPQAIEVFQKAIALDATKPKYFTNYGVALAQSGRLDLALGAFATAAALDPSDPDNFQNAGIALLQLGRVDQARASLGRAYELDHSRTQLLQELIRLSPAGSTSGNPAGSGQPTP